MYAIALRLVLVDGVVVNIVGRSGVLLSMANAIDLRVVRGIAETPATIGVVFIVNATDRRDLSELDDGETQQVCCSCCSLLLIMSEILLLGLM